MRRRVSRWKIAGTRITPQQIVPGPKSSQRSEFHFAQEYFEELNRDSFGQGAKLQGGTVARGAPGEDRIEKIFEPLRVGRGDGDVGEDIGEGIERVDHAKRPAAVRPGIGQRGADKAWALEEPPLEIFNEAAGREGIAGASFGPEAAKESF